MTVGDALAAGRERLRASGDDGRFDAMRLLEETLGRNAAWIVAHHDDELDADAAARYAEALERRAHGEPIAYIAGSVGFYGRTFAVNPDVLVPRPETEHVVALALAALGARAEPNGTVRICDAGTGSGILAVTLACELPTSTVTAIDVSPEALAVAMQNARALGVADRIRFSHGDARDVLEALAPGDRFDCIVANFPYVKTSDLQPRPDPTGFEPVLALDGGPDGLDAYRLLLPAAAARLDDCGTALFEAGPDTTGGLAELALAAFPDATVTVHRDYGGRERVVEVRRGSTPPSEKTDDP